MSHRAVRRIGHKGADAIVPGNTLESFAAAVDVGVEMVEFDVLRPRSDFAAGVDWRAAPAGPARGSGPLVLAHDWADAERRSPLTLDEALDAFTRPPLDRVEIDLDLKVAGREDEIVAALRERGLIARAMTSTMEVRSVEALENHAPDLRRGWTLPRVSRDWTRKPWARPLVGGGMLALRARLPGMIARAAPRMGVSAVWLYHALATRRIADAAHAADCELYCWTVDDAARMRQLAELGADAICTNDPRLFARM